MPIITDGESGLLARGNINRGGALAYFNSPGVGVDCTDALQDDLDLIGASGGGTVQLGSQQYLLSGRIQIPKCVSLRGTQQTPFFSHFVDQAARDNYTPTRDVPYTMGTVLRTTAGAGDEDSDPFITVLDNAGVEHLSIFHPNQDDSLVTPTEYPWAISLSGTGLSGFGSFVESVQLINPWRGILASNFSFAHSIRNVKGQPLKQGLQVGRCYDVSHIERVHWVPAWSFTLGSTNGSGGTFTNAFLFQRDNLIAYQFGRSDEQVCQDLFVYGANTGILFQEDSGSEAPATAGGTTYGRFDQIRLDAVNKGIHVKHISRFGVQFNELNIIAFVSSPQYGIKVDSTNTGRLEVDGFTIRNDNDDVGPTRPVYIQGSGTVALRAGTFLGNGTAAAIETSAPTTIVEGMLFNKACNSTQRHVRGTAGNENLLGTGMVSEEGVGISVSSVARNVYVDGNVPTAGTISPTVTVVEDTFTAADNTLISGRTPSPTTAGFNWVLEAGTSALNKIVGNKMQMDDTGAAGQIVSVDSGVSDGSVFATVFVNSTATAGCTFAIGVRSTNGSNHIRIMMTAAGLTIVKVEADVLSGAVLDPTFNFQAGTVYVMKITLDGSLVMVEVGAHKISGTFTFQETATEIDVIAYGLIATVDDVRVDG